VKLLVPIAIAAAAVAVYAFGSGTSAGAGWSRLGSGTLTPGKRYRVSWSIADIDPNNPDMITAADLRAFWQRMGNNPADIVAVWTPSSADGQLKATPRPSDWPSEDPGPLNRMAFEVVPTKLMQLAPVAGTMVWVKN
jgi:hypothetical protein